MLGAGTAFAGAGAPIPEKPEGGPPSGRPGAVLDETKCKSVWSLTEREGDTLAKDKAAPFIVNFEMVDTNKDGKVTQDEFTEACKKGLVQEAATKARLVVGKRQNSRPLKSDDGEALGDDWLGALRRSHLPAY